MREVVARYEIRPIARLSARWSCYRAETRLSGPVRIDLQHVRFDSRYAEPAAVAALLGKREGEDMARERALQATFANFHVAWASLGAHAPALIDAFLHAHGLDLMGGGSAAGSSVLVHYMRVCRPKHWRALRKADVGAPKKPSQWRPPADLGARRPHGASSEAPLQTSA